MARFLTLAEVAGSDFLRYDHDGPLTPRKLASCREWLRRRGIRPAIKRGLFDPAVIQRVIASESIPRRQQRSEQSRPSQAKQSQRALHGAGVSRQIISRHAPQSRKADAGSPLNSIEGGVR